MQYDVNKTLAGTQFQISQFCLPSFSQVTFQKFYSIRIKITSLAIVLLLTSVQNTLQSNILIFLLKLIRMHQWERQEVM